MNRENEIKVLLVDDESINNEMLQFYIQEYFDQNKKFEKIKIDTAEQGYEALGMHLVHKYDLIMLDVKMPKCDGLKFLTSVRQNSCIPQAKICMVTSLGEEKHKTLFRLKGANSYIIKPYDKEIVFSILDYFLPNPQEVEVEDSTSEFEFDFDDFDGESEPWVEEQITHANSTHRQLPAEQFIKEFEGDIDLYIELIEETDDVVDDILKTLDRDSFFDHKDEIEYILSKYGSFLNNFVEFYEISYAVHALNKIIQNINYIDTGKSGILTVEFIRFIIEDLYIWKENVFIDQEANDVFYINASILSNSIQLERELNQS